MDVSREILLVALNRAGGKYGVFMGADTYAETYVHIYT